MIVNSRDVVASNFYIILIMTAVAFVVDDIYRLFFYPFVICAFIFLDKK